MSESLEKGANSYRSSREAGSAPAARIGSGKRFGAGHGILSFKLLMISAAMFGFGYLMVPLYDIICEVTGLNGKTGRITIAESEQRLSEQNLQLQRKVTVEFVGIVSAGANWEFRPEVHEMEVVPGLQYDTTYFAKNMSDIDVVGQASPSVSPSAAAKYFNKTECFCFTRQFFEAGSSRDMPVTFVIDPDLPVNVDRVTLSYTFFKSSDQELNGNEYRPSADGKKKGKVLFNQLGPAS